MSAIASFRRYTLKGTYKRPKPYGEPVRITLWEPLVMGFDAMGLDGWALILGNDRADLKQDGGFWGSDRSADVVKNDAAKVLPVTLESLLAAVKQTRPSRVDEAVLASELAQLKQLFENAVADKAGVDMECLDAE